jgi:ankyrin repeat protein
VKSTWQAVEFARNTTHARNDARQLWERTTDLFTLVTRIESVVEGHTEPFDQDIIPIVRKALTASNWTLDELSRRCLDLGDRDDLTLLSRMMRPVYFTLSSKSIQRFEQQLQTNIISVQIALSLLDRGEQQDMARRIEVLLTALEAAVGIIASSVRSSQIETLDHAHLSSAELKVLEGRIEAATNTSTKPSTTSTKFQDYATDEEEVPGSPIDLLTTEEALAWGSVDRQLSGTTIASATRRTESTIIVNKAIEEHTPGRVQQLLDDGVDMNGTDDRGYTPLMYAISKHGKHCKECLECMIFLLRRKVKTNVDNQGITALHMAVMHDHVEAVRLLLEYGTDIDASYPNTPMMMAVRRDQFIIVELLLTFGPTINILDKAGWGLLHHAVWRDCRQALRVLLEQNKNRDLKLNLDARCGADWTPLMHLAESAHRPANADLARILLDYGASLDATDMSGHSALYYAITGGAASSQRNEFIGLLLGRGTNAEAVRLQMPKRVRLFPAFK